MPAGWSVWLCDHNGLRLQDLSQNQGFEFVRIQNSVGSFRLDMEQGFDDTLLGVNRRVEIWRNFPGESVLLFTGLVDGWEHVDEPNPGKKVFIKGGCINKLLDQRIITQTPSVSRTPVLLVGEKGTGGDGTARVWRSTNNGQNWTAIDSYNPDGFYNYSYVETETGDILGGVGLTPAGIYRSRNAGLTWSYVTGLGSEWAVVCLERADNGNIIAGTYPNAELWLSRNNGSTWTKSADSNGANWVYALGKAANGNIVAGTDGGTTFMISRSDGEAWSAASASGPPGHTFSFTTAANGDMFAGTGNNGKIFWSKDHGATWVENTDLGGSIADIPSMCVAANGDIFAGADTFVAGSIWRSQNDGGSWASVQALGNARPEGLIRAPNDNLVCAAGDSAAAAIWLSTDHGATWGSVQATGAEMLCAYSVSGTGGK